MGTEYSRAIYRNLGALLGATVLLASCSSSVDGLDNAADLTASGGGPTAGPDPTLVEVQRLVAMDAARHDGFGFSSAASVDTVAVGAPFAGVAGEVYVYRRSANGVWREQQLLAPGGFSDGDNFGYALAIDEDLLVVGARRADAAAEEAGTAYVYERDADGTWSLSQKLWALAPQPHARFGESVAVSNGRIFVGAPGEDRVEPDAGAVHLFEADANGLWATSREFEASRPQAKGLFGASVAATSELLVAGAPGERVDGQLGAGAAYLYGPDAVLPEDQPTRLVSSAPDKAGHFGASVAAAADILAVGAPGEDWAAKDAGSVHIFEREEAGWQPQARLEPPRPQRAAQFGWSVAIDGSDVAVGAPGLDDEASPGAGALFLYRASAADWRLQSRTETGGLREGSAPGAMGLASTQPRAGTSVALAGDIVVAGIPYQDWAGTSDLGTASLMQRPNRAPRVADVTVRVVEDSNARLLVEDVGADPDGDRVWFSYVGPPPVGQLRADGDGNHSYTPPIDFDRRSRAVVRLTDGRLESEDATVIFEVDAVNDAPTLMRPTPEDGAVLTVAPGEQLDMRLKAVDVEGDELSYEIISLPTGASFDAQTGKLSWRPAEDDLGRHPMILVATDGKLDDSREIIVEVGQRDPGADDKDNDGPTHAPPPPPSGIGCSSAPSPVSAGGWLLLLVAGLVRLVRPRR